ncbi:MAG: RecB family exonuclease [Thermoguttaceae bacterium]
MNTLHQLDEPRDTGLLAYISASRLNLWARCPMAFRFRYIDAITTPTNANLFLGKAVHSALAMYYRHRQVSPNAPTVADAASFTSQAWETTTAEDAMDWDSVADEEKSRGQAVELVKAYINEYASQPERIVAMEVSLEAPLLDSTTGNELGVPLFGVVDLVLQEDATPVVVDFKTTASATSVCEQAHATQLSVYAELLESNGYANVETEIRQLVKTKTPKVCAYRFGERGDRQRRQFFGLCREYLDGIAIESGV